MELNNNWGIDEDIDVIEKPNNRITDQWTETTAEAFGDSEYTRKGNLAEEIILDYFTKIYDFAYRNESDKTEQLAGKDITFGYNPPRWQRPYHVDVKSNLSNYSFSVDIPKLLKAKTDRWLHLDMDTMWYVMYGVDEMIDHLRKQGDLDKPYVYFSTGRAKRPSFFRMGRVEQ